MRTAGVQYEFIVTMQRMQPVFNLCHANATVSATYMTS